MNILENINYETKELRCGICGKWFKPESRNQFNNLVSKAKRLNRIFYCSNECRRLNNGSLKLICDNCGLELHHIDGNHKNNTLDNTLLLCPNCHSLTDNYKFKNAHKSTRDRRKYNK